MVAEHTLDDLAQSGRVDHFLLHLFISGWERGFHHFGSNGSGESSEEEIGALIVSQGVFCEAEQFFERGDVGIDVGPLHTMAVK